MTAALTIGGSLVKTIAMRTLFLIPALLAASPLPAQPIDPAVQVRIDRILKQAPLIDGHNDLAEQLREIYQSSIDGLASGGASRAKPLMTDMARLHAGRVGGQFWSVWIDGTIKGDEAIRETLEQIDIVSRLIRAYPRDLEQAYTADDIVRIHKSGRVASLIGIEGGRQIGGSLAALRQFYRLGARYMTLTHNQTTEWADSGTDEPKYDGLSSFGLQVVKEMNRLGMLVDISHVAPSTMKDAITASRAPVIFSHSDVAALNPHPRSVPDDVLRLLPANGGVIMVTFVPPFLAAESWAWGREQSAEQARLKSLYSFDKARQEAELKSWEASHPTPKVTVATVADHIEHAVTIAGHDYVGIGGDLDGIDRTVTGLDGVEDYPNLFAELIRRGWSDENLAKLAGGNILRALRQAEAVAAAMKDEPPGMATLEPAK
jgi:membrane dipeptidase